MKGPGTHLKELLASLGFRETSSCKCGDKAQEMDRQGPEWCRRNLPLLVTWLSTAARTRKWMRPLAATGAISVAARALLLKAIDRSESDRNL